MKINKKINIKFADQSEEDRFYRFHSQNVFMTDAFPSHCGITDSGNIFIAYDKNEHKIDLISRENNIPDKHIPILDYHIQQIIYSTSKIEYFGLIINKISSHEKAVHVYTNLEMIESHITNILDYRSIIRYNQELYDNIRHMHGINGEKKTPETNPDRFEKSLCIIEFKHHEIAQNVSYISCCPINGNFLILLRKKILLYHLVFCTLPTSQVVTIDFILTRVINLPWEPEIASLSFNYVAFMSAAHFSLIHMEIDQTSKVYRCSYRHNESNEVVFHRLFDQTNYNSSDNHAEMIYGPVGSNVGCKVEILDSSMKVQPILNRYNLVFCRKFHKRRSPKSILCAKSANFRINRQFLASKSKKDYLLYKYKLVPYKEPNTGILMAMILFVMSDNEIMLYVIDLRRDHLRLAPISKLVVDPPKIFKDFSFSIQEDLIHILTNNSLDTYVTHLHSFLASDNYELLSYIRPIKRMFQITSNHFFNVIATFSSLYSVILISNEVDHRNTIYELSRLKFEQLQEEVLKKIDHIKNIPNVMNGEVQKEIKVEPSLIIEHREEQQQKESKKIQIGPFSDLAQKFEERTTVEQTMNSLTSVINITKAGPSFNTCPSSIEEKLLNPNHKTMSENYKEMIEADGPPSYNVILANDESTDSSLKKHLINKIILTPKNPTISAKIFVPETSRPANLTSTLNIYDFKTSVHDNKIIHRSSNTQISEKFSKVDESVNILSSKSEQQLMSAYNNESQSTKDMVKESNDEKIIIQDDMKDYRTNFLPTTSHIKSEIFESVDCENKENETIFSSSPFTNDKKKNNLCMMEHQFCSDDDADDEDEDTKFNDMLESESMNYRHLTHKRSSSLSRTTSITIDNRKSFTQQHQQQNHPESLGIDISVFRELVGDMILKMAPSSHEKVDLLKKYHELKATLLGMIGVEKNSNQSRFLSQEIWHCLVNYFVDDQDLLEDHDYIVTPKRTPQSEPEEQKSQQLDSQDLFVDADCDDNNDNSIASMDCISINSESSFGENIMDISSDNLDNMNISDEEVQESHDTNQKIIDWVAEDFQNKGNSMKSIKTISGIKRQHDQMDSDNDDEMKFSDGTHHDGDNGDDGQKTIGKYSQFDPHYDNNDQSNFNCSLTTKDLSFEERIRQPYYYLYGLTKFSYHCPLPRYNLSRIRDSCEKIRRDIEKTFLDSKQWLF